MKPAPALVAAAGIWFLLGAAGFFSDTVALIWLYAGLVLLPFVVADGIALYVLADRLTVKRHIPSYLAQDESAAVTLEVRRSGTGFLPFRILLWDIHPASMETIEADTFPAVLEREQLAANGAALLFQYALQPAERGQWSFRGTELLLSSLCRFWQLKVFHPCESSGRTYPNFKKIQAAAGEDLRGLLERTGLKNIRMRGQGMEFRSLREYQEGDSLRNVDWRATGRRRKVIVREYQEEQDQQVLFLLDSGYRLHRLDDADPRRSTSSRATPRLATTPRLVTTPRMQFDSALEAVLLLSWVSLKHGDSAAVGTFGSSSRWLAPHKGVSAFPILMNGLYDLTSAPVPSSPFSALEDALARLKRRTFIILISNFREEDGESLSWIVKHIEKRHLLLVVSLKEAESEFLATRRAVGAESALESAAAFSYLSARRELYASWEHTGLLTMECRARDLSSALISRYLQVKRSGRL